MYKVCIISQIYVLLQLSVEIGTPENCHDYIPISSVLAVSCKSWTLDYGLDSGLEYGLNHGRIKPYVYTGTKLQPQMLVECLELWGKHEQTQPA